jgi:hypothetical protein
MRHPLTAQQVAIVRRIYQVMRTANAEWATVLILLGIEGEITGGNLDCDEPYLEVRDGG